MKIEVAIAELRGVRLALAFVDAAWARPGAGDALIARLGPCLPPLPVMLVASDGGAYAHFQTAVFAALVPLARRDPEFGLFTVDLDAPLTSSEALPF
jgi:hypothetical protein